jgi:hypothetical protein
MYRLVDNQYFSLRKHPHILWDFGDVGRLRRKLLRTLNGCHTRKYRISLRERLYRIIDSIFGLNRKTTDIRKPGKGYIGPIAKSTFGNSDLKNRRNIKVERRRKATN